MVELKLKEYMERLRSIYFHALCAFYLRENIQEATATDIVPDQAEENHKVISEFNNFFGTAKECASSFALLQLAKLYDDAHKSLHLTSIMNYAQVNSKYFSADWFKSQNAGREMVGELTERYKGLQQEDFKIMFNALGKIKPLKDKLKTYRDQYLAHEDKKQLEVKISAGEALELFEAAAVLLNIISDKTDFSQYSYDHIKDNFKNEITCMLDALKKR